MKKYLFIGAFLFPAIASKSQVRVTFKNATPYGIKVYIPVSSVLDSIPPNGQTEPLIFPAVSTNQELIIDRGNTKYPVNNNRSLKEIVYTSGSYLITIKWDAKKNRFTAILKPL